MANPTKPEKRPVEPRKTLPSVEELRALFSYDPHSGKLTNINGTKMRIAGSEVGHLTPDGYIRVVVGKNDRYFAHRIAWKMAAGSEPPEFIDHIDGNRRNNAIHNLRVADPKTNSHNVRTHKRNKLGVKGVSLCAATGRYAAFIRKDGKNRFLGRFSSLSEAAAAYETAALSAFGEYAYARKAA